MSALSFAVILAMVGVNAVFAGYEIALASVTLARLQRLAAENRRGAAVAIRMKQRMEASLAVVQLGITLVGAIAAAVGGAGAEESLAPSLAAGLGVSGATADVLAIALVVLPLTVVTIVFGELIPKVFALRNPERVCLALSPVMVWFSRSVRPAVWLLETLVRGIMSLGGRRAAGGPGSLSETAALQELRAYAAMARTSRLIGHREEGIILGATMLKDRPVREIMLPAAHMSTLDADASLSQNLVAAHLEMHTRFPVVERRGDPQSVLGYVNVKDVIATMHLSPHEPSLRAVVRPIPSFREEEPLSECLERLMRERTHIALVRDAKGLVTGMVCLEDILEELVGDIEDEYDRLPSHVTGTGTSFVAGGGATLDRLRAATGLDLAAASPAPGASTLDEWVAACLGRAARGGDVVERGPIRVLVRKTRRNRVQEAQVGRSA